jgi:tetratricopeptide (TPR) repeat protein
MPLLVVGQKRKGLTAFKNAIKCVTAAEQQAAAGDNGGAILSYNQALDLLRSDLCRQALEAEVIVDREWSDCVVTATFGKVRAVVAIDRRSVVFEQADKMMFDVFALRPDSLPAHEFMADLALARGYTQNAWKHINRLLAIDPKHQRARFLLAVLDFENCQYDDAIRRLSSLAESGGSVCYLARCLLRTGRIGEAIEILERARWNFGEGFEVVYYLGCAFAHAGRLDDARSAFEAAAGLDQARGDPLIQLGNLHLISGAYADAERRFREAINRATRHSVASYYGLALVALETGSEQERSCIENLRRVAPNSDWLHCALANRAERAGNVVEAEREYLSVSPKTALGAAAYCRLGFMRYRAGNFAGAYEALQQSARLRSTDNDLLGLLGAAAALAGYCSAAVKAWSQSRARDARTTRALRQAAMRIIIEDISEGRIRKAIDQLEAYQRGAGEDESVQKALADLYFIEAVELLKTEPPEISRARELLLWGKNQTGHPKFDYCLAIADLVEGHNELAAGRLRAVVAANAKNPGASYHLGLALIRCGDDASAETALRHGVAVSMNNPARLGRLKWALAALLVSQERWPEAAEALTGFVPGEEADSHQTAVEVLDLHIRCLAMSGEWEEAERIVLSSPSRKKTTIAGVLLTRRNIKSGRTAAAFLHVDRFLKLARKDGSISPALIDKARGAFVQLALKVAAKQLQELHPLEAEVTLKRAIPVLSLMRAPAAASAAVKEFLEALDVDHEDSRVVNEIAGYYEALPIDVILEKEDFRPAPIEIPVVMPPKPHPAFDLLKEFLFDPHEWNADPHPNPLVAFDS